MPTPFPSAGTQKQNLEAEIKAAKGTYDLIVRVFRGRFSR
jgi:hypothetical protein